MLLAIYPGFAAFHVEGGSPGTGLVRATPHSRRMLRQRVNIWGGVAREVAETAKLCGQLGKPAVRRRNTNIG